MKTSSISREDALALLKTWNSEPFHLLHALTVEGVMRYFARERGYADEEEFWGLSGFFTTLILNAFPKNIAARRRNCCARAA